MITTLSVKSHTLSDSNATYTYIRQDSNVADSYKQNVWDYKNANFNLTFKLLISLIKNVTEIKSLSKLTTYIV